jgi:hypothetical protein
MKKLFFLISMFLLIVFISCNLPTEELIEDEEKPEPIEPRTTIIGQVLTYEDKIPLPNVRLIATTLNPLNPAIEYNDFLEQGIAISDENGNFVIDRNVGGDILLGGTYKIISGLMNWNDNYSVYVDYDLVSSEVVFPEVTIAYTDTVNLGEINVTQDNPYGENPLVKEAIALDGIKINSADKIPWEENAELSIGLGDTITFYWETPDPQYSYAFAILGSQAEADTSFVIFQYPESVEHLITQTEYEFVNDDGSGQPILNEGRFYRWTVVGAKNTQGNILLINATTSELFLGDFKVIGKEE